MPKYEDFVVGDVWICRDGGEADITAIENQTAFPIRADVGPRSSLLFTEDGFYRSDKTPNGCDLIHKKHALDLTKPLRFKGETDGGFMLHELENVPEPVILKQWAVVHKNTGLFEGLYSTENGAERNCHSDQVVVELTGTYRV